MTTKEIIGKNIKKYRKAAGHTQQDLGKKIGYSDSGISAFEKGVNDIDNLMNTDINDAAFSIPLLYLKMRFTFINFVYKHLFLSAVWQFSLVHSIPSFLFKFCFPFLR